MNWKLDATHHAWEMRDRGSEQASDRQEWLTSISQGFSHPDWVWADEAANSFMAEALGWAQRQSEVTLRQPNGPVDDDDWADAVLELLACETLSGDG
jgi:hypothetical protein